MPVTSLDLASLKALQSEPPKTLIALVRIAWPEIRLALVHGHSLRVVHQRLADARVPITYRLLSQYVCRLRREEQSAVEMPLFPGAKITSHFAGPAKPARTADIDISAQSAAPQDHSKHPLADFEQRIGKVKTFNFKPGLPDESKLI